MEIIVKCDCGAEQTHRRKFNAAYRSRKVCGAGLEFRLESIHFATFELVKVQTESRYNRPSASAGTGHRNIYLFARHARNSRTPQHVPRGVAGHLKPAVRLRSKPSAFLTGAAPLIDRRLVPLA